MSITCLLFSKYVEEVSFPQEGPPHLAALLAPAAGSAAPAPDRVSCGAKSLSG